MVQAHALVVAAEDARQDKDVHYIPAGGGTVARVVECTQYRSDVAQGWGAREQYCKYRVYLPEGRRDEDPRSTLNPVLETLGSYRVCNASAPSGIDWCYSALRGPQGCRSLIEIGWLLCLVVEQVGGSLADPIGLYSIIKCWRRCIRAEGILGARMTGIVVLSYLL